MAPSSQQHHVAERDPSVGTIPFVVPIWQSERKDGDMGSSAHPHNAARQAFLAHRNLRHCRLNHQEHGRRIHIIKELSAEYEGGRQLVGDGLITACPRQALAVTVADCLPLFVAAPVAGVTAILHSGRRSTGILAEAVDILERRYAIAPATLHLYIGAGIGACCYRVDSNIQHQFLTQLYSYLPSQQLTNIYGSDAQGHWIDLRAANVALARQRGIVHIEGNVRCSCCDQRLFSYRRQGTHYGHMLAVIENRLVHS